VVAAVPPSVLSVCSHRRTGRDADGGRLRIAPQLVLQADVVVVAHR
jgi:hypothetical protein